MYSHDKSSRALEQRCRSTVRIYCRPGSWAFCADLVIIGLCQQLCPEVVVVRAVNASAQLTMRQVGLDDKMPVN